MSVFCLVSLPRNQAQFLPPQIVATVRLPNAKALSGCESTTKSPGYGPQVLVLCDLPGLAPFLGVSKIDV